MAKDAWKGKDPAQEKEAEAARAGKEKNEAKTFLRLARQYLEE